MKKLSLRCEVIGPVSAQLIGLSPRLMPSLLFTAASFGKGTSAGPLSISRDQPWAAVTIPVCKHSRHCTSGTCSTLRSSASPAESSCMFEAGNAEERWGPRPTGSSFYL